MGLTARTFRVEEEKCPFAYGMELRLSPLIVRWNFFRNNADDYLQVQNVVRIVNQVIDGVRENKYITEGADTPWIRQLAFFPRTEWTSGKLWFLFLDQRSSTRVEQVGSDFALESLQSYRAAFEEVVQLFKNDEQNDAQRRHQVPDDRLPELDEGCLT